MTDFTADILVLSVPTGQSRKIDRDPLDLVLRNPGNDPVITFAVNDRHRVRTDGAFRTKKSE
jgi:hypothetical protein